jgi:hypothetical protein
VQPVNCPHTGPHCAVTGGFNQRDGYARSKHAGRSAFERATQPGVVSRDQRNVDAISVQRATGIGHEDVAGDGARLAATLYDVAGAE